MSLQGDGAVLMTLTGRMPGQVPLREQCATVIGRLRVRVTRGERRVNQLAIVRADDVGDRGFVKSRDERRRERDYGQCQTDRPEATLQACTHHGWAIGRRCRAFLQSAARFM